MHSITDPTRMLGRYSQVVTPSGVISGTIMAVGARGIDVAVNHHVVRIAPSEIHEISTAR